MKLSEWIAEVSRKDASQWDRLVAMGEIAAIGPSAEAAIPVLIRVLRDQDERVRGKAAEALGGIGPAAKSAVPVLVVSLDDPSEDVRLSVAYSLWQIESSKQALPVLRHGTGNPSWIVRSRAISLLGMMGPAAAPAVPELLVALQADAAFEGQEEAPVLDLNSDPPRMRPPQVSREMLDKAATIRGAAAHALGEIGPASEAAAPALRRVARSDPDPDVRLKARDALTRIVAR